VRTCTPVCCLYVSLRVCLFSTGRLYLTIAYHPIFVSNRSNCVFDTHCMQPMKALWCLRVRVCLVSEAAKIMSSRSQAVSVRLLMRINLFKGMLSVESSVFQMFLMSFRNAVVFLNRLMLKRHCKTLNSSVLR